MFAKYVEGYGDGDADEALKRLGIEEGMDGLNFLRSEMFSAENPNQIHLVCYYTVRMSPLIDLPGEGRMVLCKESMTNAWLNGLGKKAIDEGDGAGEEKPEEKPEEEKEDEEPDFLKKLREAYGDEVIDTLKAENDTSEWDNDEWVKQIWYYQNRKIINAMDPHTSLGRPAAQPIWKL